MNEYSIIVAVAMAFAPPLSQPPAPVVKPCCSACKGTGMIPVNDPNLGPNARISCNCPPTCACVANRPKPNVRPSPCVSGTCHPRPQ